VISPRLAPLARALLAALALGGAGCGNSPSKSDCEKLRAHLVDLEAAASGADTASAGSRSEFEAQKKKVTEAIKLDYCLEDLSVSQVKCGLKARSLEELATACDKS